MAEEELNPETREGAGARVLREVIRTPAFLEIIKTNITGFEPEDARALVRTFLREDANLSLSLIGTSPVVINYIVEAILEMGLAACGVPARPAGYVRIADDLRDRFGCP